MDILISIITNAAFITIATLVLKNYLAGRLQIQKGTIDERLESLKSDLQLKLNTEQEKVNKKREVYINLVDSMSIFIGNRVPVQQKPEYQTKFLKAYDTAWLWASDEVLTELSKYMELKIQDISGEQEKEAFAKCILAMRKDIGFLNSHITPDDYKFITF